MQKLCEQITELIPLYDDGVLTEHEMNLVDEHLAVCAECRQVYEEMSEMLDKLHDIEQEPLPEGLSAELEQALSKEIKSEASPKFDVKVVVKSSRMRSMMPRFALVAAGLVCVMIALSVVGVGINSVRTAASRKAELTIQSAPALSNMRVGKTVDLNDAKWFFKGDNAEIAITSDEADVASEVAVTDEITVAEASTEAYSTTDSAKTILPVPPIEPSIQSSSVNGSMLQKTYTIMVELEDIANWDHTMIEALGGFNVNASTDFMDRRSIRSYYTRRVYATDYERSKTMLRSIGRVVSEYEGTQNLSGSYTDTIARIKSKSEEQDRLLKLLKGSVSISYMTAVESRLSVVSQELDGLKGQARYLAELSEMPLLNITLYTTYEETAQQIEQGFPERLSNAFVMSLNSTVLLMERFLIFISGAFMPVAVFVMVVLVFVAIVRAVIKRKARQIERESGGRTDENDDKNE